MEGHGRSIATRTTVAAVHTTGKVVGAGPEGYAVRTGSGVLGARRAASCLLEPELGDEVMIAGDTSERVYVIAVLERATDRPPRIAFHGDVQVIAIGGTMTLQADAGLNLSTDAQLRLAANHLMVQSKRVTLLLEKLAAFGGEVAASIGRLRLIGNAVESFVERVTQSAKHSLRTVSETDQVRAGAVDYRANQTVSLHGRNVLATAKQLVKLDGEQLHLG